MIRALWFILKVAIVVAVALWVAGHPGSVVVDWMGYTVKVHIGLFLAVFFAVILVSIFLYTFVRALVTLPSGYTYYRHIKNRDEGYKALTRGLVAVAAGDSKAASRQAEKASRLLSEGGLSGQSSGKKRAGKGTAEDNGLALLLQAQAARLRGDTDQARKSFSALLENKDAAFLGIKGLLNDAMDRRDYEHAGTLIGKALDLYPRQPWLLGVAYDLYTRRRCWDDARKVLKTQEKTKEVSSEKGHRDRAAMLIAEANDLPDNEALKKAEKAFREDRSFVPAALFLARLQNKTGKRRSALATIKKTWKSTPHPALLDLWESMIAPSTQKKPMGHEAWKKKLTDLNKVPMDEHLGKSWVCIRTGRIYDTWSPIAYPHGSFNTIEWMDPADLDLGNDRFLPHTGVKQDDDILQALPEKP